jgi:nuclear pore complex protein Nup155
LNDTANQPTEAFKAILGKKLESLGKSYASSEKYFPLGFIVGYLESKVQRQEMESAWLVELLSNLGFSLPLLVETYHRLYKTRSQNLNWNGKQEQLLSVLVHLFKQFASSPNNVPRLERRSFVTKSLDILSGYLLDLQSSSSSNAFSRNLVSELRSLQTTLEQRV